MTRTGNANTISLPKNWAAVGEMVIVVVTDDNTIVLKKNIEINIPDVKKSQEQGL